MAARKAVRKDVDRRLKDEDAKVRERGLAAAKAGKDAEAVRLLGFYMKKNPGDKAAGKALTQARGRLGEAVDELLQGAARELVGGDRGKAKDLAAQALKLDPESARARKLLEQAGQAEAPKTDAAAVKKLYYDGVEQYLSGDLAAAVATWKKVLAQDPEHLDAKRSLARAELELDALKKRGKS